MYLSCGRTVTQHDVMGHMMKTLRGGLFYLYLSCIRGDLMSSQRVDCTCHAAVQPVMAGLTFVSGHSGSLLQNDRLETKLPLSLRRKCTDVPPHPQVTMCMMCHSSTDADVCACNREYRIRELGVCTDAMWEWLLAADPQHVIW